MMIASLPMYDRPETQASNDRFWQLIRNQLGPGLAAPEELSRTTDPWQDWENPELLLSQTCGYPYRTRLHGKTRLVATPVYDLPDCPPGHYYSVLIARKNDPRGGFEDFAGARLAYNDALSQSGWAAPHSHAEDKGFRFTDVTQTGAHRSSAQAVASGIADIAAIDAVSWAMIRRWDSFAADLREIGVTAPTPTLPYITSATGPALDLAGAIASALDDLPARDRGSLLLSGVVGIPAEAYLAVPNPQAPPELNA